MKYVNLRKIEDVQDSSSASAVWEPFSGETDWELAKWFIKEGIGQGAVDRFLRIPQVSNIHLGP